MALDSRYVIAPNQQEVFLNKDTGCPLSGGTVKFFKDQDRSPTGTKDVFMLSGTAPNYTFVNIGSEIELNAAGAPSYEGNDIRVVYFPYDDDGNQELYFSEVFDAGGVSQFTREAWPLEAEQGASPIIDFDNAFTNYIPNGQFWLHNDFPNSGLIENAVTQIAYGKWTFTRPESSNANDNVTFVRFGSYITNPEAHPRYAVRVVNSGGGSGDDFKDIRVQFDDVNRFGSDTQKFTFKFSARSTAGNANVDAILIKNYGTNGSGETRTTLQTFTLSGAYQSFAISFVFGDNSDKTIGILNDDYIQLGIRFPVGVVFEIEAVDFALVEGDFSDVNFPDTTNRQSISQSLGGSFATPDYEGRDLYLPTILTPTGIDYDRSQIGKVFVNSYGDISVGELLADGSSFVASDYSTDGIPYRRLQEKYWDDINYTPIHGTGTGYGIAYFPGNTTSNEILFSNNDAGISAGAVDGSTPTNFEFSNIHVAINGDYGINAWISSPENAWIQNKAAGTLHQVSSNDSTFNPLDGNTGMGIANLFLLEGTIRRRITNSVGNRTYTKGLSVPQEFNITFSDGSSLVNPGFSGKYFTFRTITTAYYVWYFSTNELDPNVGGHTGIRVNISSTDDAATVAEKTIFAMNNFQSNVIKTTDANLMTAGSYFNIDMTGGNFYYWYKIDGSGDDPDVINRTGVMIDIDSSDLAVDVARKTIIAINSYQYAIPDYRGLILKSVLGNRNDIGLDDDVSVRFSRNNVKYGGNQISSQQLSINREHYHKNIISSPHRSGAAVSNPGSTIDVKNEPFDITYATNNTLYSFAGEDGGTSSRPANAYINYVIKY